MVFHTVSKTRYVIGIEYESEDDPNLVVKPFHQLITLLHRKGKDNQDYKNFESSVRAYLHKPPFNVILPPSSEVRSIITYMYMMIVLHDYIILY